MTGAVALPDAPLFDEPPTRRRGVVAVQIPGFLVLALGVVLGAFEGGSAPADWYPAALFLAALATLTALVAPPTRVERARAWNVALVLFGLFTLWSYLSILWAGAPADAWDGANRTLMYWLAVAVVGLRPWPAPAARAALALVGFGCAALAIGVMAVAAFGDDAARVFLQGRLSEPTGYANATGCLFLIGLWPALQLALDLRWSWPLRALAFGAACLLLEVAVLTQSRGAALALAATAIVFVALHPRRFPALLALVTLGALSASTWTTLTSVREAATAAEIGPALADARAALALACALAVLAGAIAVLVARQLFGRSGVSSRIRRRGDLALAVVAGVLAIGALAGATTTGWLGDRWEAFKTQDYEEVESGSTRFTGALGSGRYDYYRVALNEFRDEPLLGIGTDNFAIPYLAQRRTPEAPAHPHSLAIRVLSQLGIVGTLLFCGFLIAALAGFARVRRKGTASERAVAVGALCGAVVWFVHGLADWLWEFPALSLLALGLLAIAARTGTAPVSRRRLGGGWRGRLGLRVGIAVVALLATVTFALPGAAARYESAAGGAARNGDRETAMRRLDRARTLNRLDPDPVLSRAILARRRGDLATARADLAEALRREETNWFAHFEMALLDAVEGDRPAAQARLSRARELNPRQPLLASVGKALRSGRPIDPDEVEGMLYGQLASKLAPTE